MLKKNKTPRKIILIVNFFIKFFFKTKWKFLKPKKSNILIYDRESIGELDFYLKKKEYEIFHTRYEQINIYIILYTILVDGIKNLKENYKLNYFRIVSPKVVITLIDENTGFFKLKNLYPYAKYVSIQIIFKDNRFYNYIRDFKKKYNNFKFRSDVSFVLGNNDKIKYKKYLKSKIVSLGSIKNNNFPLKKNYNKKIDKILFISGSLPKNRKDVETKYLRAIKIFNFLESYCSEKNIKLFLLSKYKGNILSKYKEYYGDGNWKFVAKKNTQETYKIINNSQFIVSENSTLTYEAFSKNIKGVCFPEVFPYKNYSRVINKKQGFFWSTSISKKILFSKINKVTKLNQKKWKNIVSKEIKNIITYNPQNIIFSKTVDKFLK